MLVRNALLVAVVVVVGAMPYEGSSWDEPSTGLIDDGDEAALLLLLTGIDQEASAGQETQSGAISDFFLAGKQSSDCVQLWLAYVNAIVQLEVAQANLTKIQSAIEKCLERRTQSAPQADPVTPNSLIGLDDSLSGSIELQLGTENEGSVID
jgi:hypothetical protein